MFHEPLPHEAKRWSERRRAKWKTDRFLAGKRHLSRSQDRAINLIENIDWRWEILTARQTRAERITRARLHPRIRRKV